MSLIMTALLCLVGATAQEKKHDAFEKLKELAGSWEPSEKGGMQMSITYKVTSGGSTVMEMIAEGTEHEMVSMYHMDGHDLVMTHYCMLGNQPHFKAEKEMKGNSLKFVCSGGANVKCDTDKHMHQLVMTFVDKDTLKAEWTLWEGGKAAMTHTMNLKRKK